MPNNSATGGYLNPTSSTPLPGSLSLEDFIHTVIVGVSNYSKPLVRPKWQVAPPKQPDISVNWIAFAIANSIPDAYAYVAMNDNGSTNLMRQEKLEIQLAFYGPNALENMGVFRDGFQIQQNLEAMRLASMAYNGVTTGIRGPDLVNERWVDRWEMSLFLMRQVLRVYPVLEFVGASGTIHSVINQEEYNAEFDSANHTGE